ncbi:hypothetical protein Bca52824_001067 [Brassica carinata]|uniref:Uncharacterized protein n=1 Tax=Brassica carinata TaxID=52824 RepID=A0A8X8BCR0_BRACI|nr:hypothetical protein Bca52824_001067 [Brassica carinata]
MDQLVELTSEGCGCLHKVDHDHRLMGTFTDGLLRQVEKLSSNSVLDKFATALFESINRKPRTIGPETMAVVAMKKIESGKWSHVCKRSSSLLMIVDEVKGKSFYGTEDVGADKRHIYKVPKDELAAVLQVTEPSKNKDTSILIYKLKDLRCYAQVLMEIKVPQACTTKACASRGSGQH